MRGITTGLTLGLLGLFAAFPAAAQSDTDPMRALRTQSAVPAPENPMFALRASSQRDDSDGPAGNEEFGGLPDAPGAEETYYQCVACHSTDIIKQQRITDARWDDLWDWMVKKQGMFEPEPETKEVILGYLKTHFSSER
ncbi:hypothetical protein [Paracoccus seriniphilus]|uniref:Cytochrome c n=1 Tax=Paracoccus seriniphilus TaxID=184748 RepID=A0A239Q277_9RHOB|nr:hypothetical protein [Paracoccus seriniphilus]WCR15881.1 cytochrome C-552 [Paracoccus seriniphilus]SNT76302.1 hypothetical protein SAMN05444959_11811 [Paracoccus seriniphilus]